MWLYLIYSREVTELLYSMLMQFFKATFLFKNEGKKTTKDTGTTFEEIQVHGAVTTIYKAVLPCCVSLRAQTVQHSKYLLKLDVSIYM